MINEEKIKFKQNFDILVNFVEYSKNKTHNSKMIDNYVKKYINKDETHTYLYMYKVRIFVFNIISHLFKKEDNSIDKFINEYYIQYNGKIYSIIFDTDISFESVRNIRKEIKIINYDDILIRLDEKYITNELNKINISIKNLLEAGYSVLEIEEYVKSILYKEKENPKQKVKRPQK